MRTLFLLAGVSHAVFGFIGQAHAQTAQPAEQTPATDPATPAGPLRATAPSATTEQVDDRIGEIIVTASRRSETIRETPTAVSAFSGDKLKTAQIASLDELAATTPNVQISSLNTTSNVTIRGIGNQQVTAGSDPGVAIHFDGAYLAQSGLVTSTFLDVSRVEVLRGPQGTLFGRNATGGAINIIPNLPTENLHYGIDASVGIDPTLVRSSAFVSGPLTNDARLRGRFALQQNYNEGFTKNLAPNGPRRLDGVETYSGRAQLMWLPTDSLTIRVLGEYDKADDNGSAFYLFGTPDPTQPLPTQLQGQPTGDPGKRTAYANVGAHEVDAKTAVVTADWALGGGNLKALYSYNEVEQFTNLENDGTAVPFASATFVQDSHQHYAEILYTSDASKPFNFVVGANYFKEKFFQDINVSILFLPVPVTLTGDLDTESYAFFGRGQYEFAPGAKVFGGVRYTHDDKAIDDFNNFVGSLSQQKSFSRVTYEVGATYDFDTSVTGYVKYATGYKGGGFSSGSLAPAYNPETNFNIEAGLKGSYLDGKLQANISAFHMKYDQLQVNQIIGVSSAVTNAAKATIDGAEIEIVALPARNLRVEVSGAYLNARFDEFLTADSSRPALGTLDLSGNRLPLAPRFNASAGAYLDVPLSSGKITLGGRFDYKSRVYFSEFNLPITSQKGVGKLDLSINYQSEDRRWTAGVFARNVTDEAVRSQAYVISAILGSLAIGQLQPGRQIGITGGYRF